MKFYIKTRKEIEKIEGTKRELSAFTTHMMHLCGRGPFEFIYAGASTKDWYVEKSEGYFWHKDWLTKKRPAARQYLLEFE